MQSALFACAFALDTSVRIAAEVAAQGAALELHETRVETYSETYSVLVLASDMKQAVLWAAVQYSGNAGHHWVEHGHGCFKDLSVTKRGDLEDPARCWPKVLAGLGPSPLAGLDREQAHGLLTRLVALSKKELDKLGAELDKAGASAEAWRHADELLSAHANAGEALGDFGHDFGPDGTDELVWPEIDALLKQHRRSPKAKEDGLDASLAVAAWDRDALAKADQEEAGTSPHVGARVKVEPTRWATDARLQATQEEGRLKLSSVGVVSDVDGSLCVVDFPRALGGFWPCSALEVIPFADGPTVEVHYPAVVVGDAAANVVVKVTAGDAVLLAPRKAPRRWLK